MAAPIASFIQLPSDSGNTGKKMQTQYESVGSDVVHSHFFVPRSTRKILGIYNFSQGVANTVLNAAHNGTTTGALWLYLLSGSTTVHMRLRRLKVEWSAAGAGTTMVTIPRLVLQRVTVGAAVGVTTAITPCKRNTADAAAVGLAASALSGANSPALVANAFAWHSMCPAYVWAANAMAWCGGPAVQWAPAFEDEFIDIAAGEGVVLYQADAGTAADIRKYVIDGCWDEYDNT
jgi:hypothetical protein